MGKNLIPRPPPLHCRKGEEWVLGTCEQEVGGICFCGCHPSRWRQETRDKDFVGQLLARHGRRKLNNGRSKHSAKTNRKTKNGTFRKKKQVGYLFCFIESYITVIVCHLPPNCWKVGTTCKKAFLPIFFGTSLEKTLLFYNIQSKGMQVVRNIFVDSNIYSCRIKT